MLLALFFLSQTPGPCRPQGQERWMDRYAERNPGLMDQSDTAIAREMLKMVRKSIKECEG